jgi:hypothetical protein
MPRFRFYQAANKLGDEENFARVCSSARTGQSRRARENNSDNAAEASYLAAEFESGRLRGLGLCLGPHLEHIPAMFDAENPGRAGGLAGESYASVLENHERYPSLRSARDAALLARLDRAVEQQIKNFAALLLPPLGFDEAGIRQYQSAAIGAFRAVLPTN